MQCVENYTNHTGPNVCSNNIMQHQLKKKRCPVVLAAMVALGHVPPPSTHCKNKLKITILGHASQPKPQ